MGGFLKLNAQRIETTQINQIVNKTVLDAFQKYVKEQGYYQNFVLENFMQQYAKKRFQINHEDIVKWKNKGSEPTRTLNTPISKSIYTKFKEECKNNGYFVKDVIMAFLEIYSSKTVLFECVNIENITPQQNNLFEARNSLTTQNETQIELPKGYIRCPFCGKYAEAVSDNWCLITPIGDTKKYLACKECKGEDSNGEYRY